MRDVDRQLRKTGRDIDRDRRELEKEEKKLVSIFFHFVFMYVKVNSLLYVSLNKRKWKLRMLLKLVTNKHAQFLLNNWCSFESRKKELIQQTVGYVP